MAKHNDQHLTTTQLSALIDKQLAAEELAVCNAHLQTCQQCQSALAGLRQTVALLQALPQPTLPRSFALPSGVTYLQQRPQRQAEQQPTVNPRTRQRSWMSYAQAVCTIAAVIGLVFLVSGLLPTLPRGGASSSTSAGTSAQSAKNASTFGPARTNAANPAIPPSPATADHNGTPVFKPQAVGTPVARVRASGTASANHSNASPRQSQPSISLLDLSTPLVRQVLGFSLFVLGIVGVLLTRRKQRDRRTT